jgi:large subunit ribosomal protein L22
MESKASAKYLRGSAQKARLVVDLIRGKNVNEALAALRFANKRAARPIETCLRSAIANASEAAEKSNIAIDPDELWVKTAYVDKGPTKKRYRMRPAPQGRAYRERRHFCHVTIMLTSEKSDRPQPAPRTKRAAPKAATGGEAKPAAAASAPAEEKKEE